MGFYFNASVNRTIQSDLLISHLLNVPNGKEYFECGRDNFEIVVCSSEQLRLKQNRLSAALLHITGRPENEPFAHIRVLRRSPEKAEDRSNAVQRALVKAVALLNCALPIDRAESLLLPVSSSQSQSTFKLMGHFDDDQSTLFDSRIAHLRHHFTWAEARRPNVFLSCWKAAPLNNRLKAKTLTTRRKPSRTNRLAQSLRIIDKMLNSSPLSRRKTKIGKRRSSTVH